LTQALRHVRHPEEVPVPETDTVEAVIAACSFCKKDNREVRRLVAGPGVYICNECVALCQELIAEDVTPEESSRRSQAFVGRGPEELLASLPGLARTAADVEAELGRWVGRLRDLGTGWEPIGAALSLTSEQARRRFEPGVGEG
jgi:ClpX C4-type zinc finger